MMGSADTDRVQRLISAMTYVFASHLGNVGGDKAVMIDRRDRADGLFADTAQKTAERNDYSVFEC